MNRSTRASLIVLGVLLAAVLLRAAANSVVVTNPAPAVSATMQLLGASDGVYTWNVSGKVKPAYRGFGATVKLLCQQYAALENGGPSVVAGGSQNNVDACGNFSFNTSVAGSAQLDNSYVCGFVVHVDGSSAPNACSSKSAPPDAFPDDPNGTAPCAGGLCPNVP